MPRVMTSDVIAAVEADAGSEFVHLLEFSFSSGFLRITTGAQDIAWNSQTWEAVGGLLEFGGVEETSDPKGQGVDVRLSGVDQGVVATLLSNHYRGRPVKIWRAHLDQTDGTVVADPILLFEGLQLNPYTIEEERAFDGGTVKISTRLAAWLGVERVRGIQTNLASHQHLHPGDLFFQHTTTLARRSIYWATFRTVVGLAPSLSDPNFNPPTSFGGGIR